MKYIVITTTTNLNNLELVGKFLAKQTVKPLKWYIFNDSPLKERIVIKGLNYKIFNLKRNKEWYYKRLACNLNLLMQQIPKKQWKEIDCVLKLDDDTIIPKDYVESLIPFIEKSNFGCVSGKIISKQNGEYIEEKRINHYAIGTGMLIRKKVFSYLGGYPRIAGSDTVINLASCYLGFQNQQLNHLTIKQTRTTCSNSGMERWLATAIKQYYLRYPNWIIWLNIRRVNKKQFLKNIKIYFRAIKKVKQEDHLNIKELIKYNRVRLLMVILRDLKKKWLKC